MWLHAWLFLTQFAVSLSIHLRLSIFTKYIPRSVTVSVSGACPTQPHSTWSWPSWVSAASTYCRQECTWCSINRVVPLAMLLSRWWRLSGRHALPWMWARAAATRNTWGKGKPKLACVILLLKKRCPVLLHGEYYIHVIHTYVKHVMKNKQTAATSKNVLYLDMLRCFNVLGMKWIWC